MGLRVTKVTRINAGYVQVKYETWHSGCEPCSKRRKSIILETTEELDEQKAEEIIRAGLHVRPRSV